MTKELEVWMEMLLEYFRGALGTRQFGQDTSKGATTIKMLLASCQLFKVIHFKKYSRIHGL